MLKMIPIILIIIFLSLSLDALLYPVHDRLFLPILALLLGLFLLKGKRKIPAFLCFSTLGIWLVILFFRNLIN